MNVSTGKVLKYTLLPGVLPRALGLFTSGFSYLAFYMAQVYLTVGLLPQGHPYLQPQNMGKYGIRHVIFEARRHLVFKKQNIDQIIIFFMMLLAIVLLFMQMGVLLLGFLVPMAMASTGVGSTAYLASFFVTPDPTYDLAFRMLDATFGFAGSATANPIFNSCLAQGVQCQLAFTPGVGFTPVGPVFTVPNDFHGALQFFFSYYNKGILAVGLIIFLYLVVAVVAETAKSGTPFGKRFNGAWVPIRLFIAIALLTPLSFGMNGAQLLTLYIAKWGSSMATNGWNSFIDDLAGETLAGAPTRLVATPNAPMMNTLTEFVFVAQACKHAELLMNQRTVEAFHIWDDNNQPFIGKAFLTSLADAENRQIIIRFGVRDDDRYTQYQGNVKPVCGEIVLHTHDVAQPGALTMQEGYYDLLADLWTDGVQDSYALNTVLRNIPTSDRDPNSILPDNAYITSTLDWFNTVIPDLVDDAVADQIASADWLEDHRALGWAGAAIWYNKIAEMNGGLFSSVYAPPLPSQYPEIMEYVKDQRRSQNDMVTEDDRFNPVLSNGDMVEFDSRRDQEMAIIMHYATTFWDAQYEPSEGSTFIDTITAIFGLEGLFNMQSNLEIHPLAQLVGVGRSLMENAVTNLGYSFGAGVAGGLAGILGRHTVKSVLSSASSFAGKVATLGLSMGFILYYIIPFLPFMYFFFAAGGWIKGIFEAMLGLPLWAIAHIRIDGDGLPGPAAMNGYFLVFEIFLRPILIVFGLIAGISIFTAQVEILNEIWKLVTSNLVGYDTTPPAAAAPAIPVDNGWGATVGSIDYMRGEVDYLFHTIIYTIIVYMMAMASFKLIDLIPNNIMRWLGTSVSTFGEQAGDPAAGLVKYAYMGSQAATGGLGSLLGRVGGR